MSIVPKESSLAPRPFTDASLLEHVRKLPHARATYKQLVRELRLQGESRDQLEAALDRLSEKGQLVELRSGHFIAVGANSEYLAACPSIATASASSFPSKATPLSRATSSFRLLKRPRG